MNDNVSLNVNAPARTNIGVMNCNEYRNGDTNQYTMEAFFNDLNSLTGNYRNSGYDNSEAGPYFEDEEGTIIQFITKNEEGSLDYNQELIKLSPWGNETKNVIERGHLDYTQYLASKTSKLTKTIRELRQSNEDKDTEIKRLKCKCSDEPIKESTREELVEMARQCKERLAQSRK